MTYNILNTFNLTDIEIKKIALAIGICAIFFLLWIITISLWHAKKKDIITFRATNLYKKNSKIQVLKVKDTRPRVYLTKKSTNIVVDRCTANFYNEYGVMDIIQYVPNKETPKFYKFIKGLFISLYVLSLILVLGIGVFLIIRLSSPELFKDLTDIYLIGFINFMQSYFSFLIFVLINVYFLTVILCTNRLIDTYKMYQESYLKMINVNKMNEINEIIYVDLDKLEEKERYKNKDKKKKIRTVSKSEIEIKDGKVITK